MNTQAKIDLIKEAQNFLVNNPQDVLHDITHHYRVWENAREIVKSENLNEIDLDILELVCWWHDVENPDLKKTEGKRTMEITAEYISSKFEGKEKEIIFDSIRNHEFGSTPNYVEGKVLQDADKLEILSEPRVRWAVENLKAGKIEKEKFVNIVKAIKTEWLPKMPERYHFNFSKNYHKENEAKFIELLDKTLEEWINT